MICNNHDCAKKLVFILLILRQSTVTDLSCVVWRRYICIMVHFLGVWALWRSYCSKSDEKFQAWTHHSDFYPSANALKPHKQQHRGQSVGKSFYHYTQWIPIVLYIYTLMWRQPFSLQNVVLTKSRVWTTNIILRLYIKLSWPSVVIVF